MKVIYTLLAIAGGCLVLGGLQCLLSAIRRPHNPKPWYRRGEKQP